MGSIAEGFVQGNLTADPEQRRTPAGKLVCGLRIAVNDTWKDDAGVKHEEVSYFRVSVWGRLGEVCAEHLKKGDECTVIGRLSQDRWEDENGNSRESFEIKADKVVFGRKAKEQRRDERQEVVQTVTTAMSEDMVRVNDGPATAAPVV